MNPQLILILGGCRSGKSRMALELGRRLGQRKLFLATAEAVDAEMRQRILMHQHSRGPEWATVEEPLALAQALRQHSADYDVTVVDCLTVWLGNLFHKLGQEGSLLHWKSIFEANLLTTLEDRSSHLVLVSNEVGLGICPENGLARQFRDEQGLINQQIAALADTVVFMAAGLPLLLKGQLPTTASPHAAANWAAGESECHAQAM